MFADVFDPLIQEYHGISANSTHTSDMDASKIVGTIDPSAPVHSTRIRLVNIRMYNDRESGKRFSTSCFS